MAPMLKLDDRKVVVAMSGGVDSSVAAALLVEQGYNVVGIMLKLWNEPGQEYANRCCTPNAMALARQIAGKLDIPFYVVDVKDSFRDIVVSMFIYGYAHGITPNPCLACNKYIRWDFLLQKAFALNAGYLVTGHYARLIRHKNAPVRLMKGVDKEKDQSYVLSVLNQNQLSHTLLPLGKYTKQEVRQLAAKYDLPVAKLKDSQDLCFLGDSDYLDFLRRNKPEIIKPGPIFNSHGKLVGEHKGLAFYTIGQRKRLGISYPTPLYVIGKRIQDNALIVGSKVELGSNDLIASQVNWISGSPPLKPIKGEIMIRYRATLYPGTVYDLGNGQFKIKFKEPVQGITPGQGAVVYKGEEVVASGIIEKKEN